MGIHKLCEIRGHVPTELTPEHYWRWGHQLGKRAGRKAKFVVGGDVRLSTPPLMAALIDGLCCAGVDLVDLGILPTPMVYYAKRRIRAAGCAVVTASHNPPDFNGLTWMVGDLPPTEDEVEQLCHASRAGRARKSPGRTQPRSLDVSFDYVAWLRQRILSKRASPYYHPELHIDVYGTLGIIFDAEVPAIASYLASLAQAAAPFALRIEGPVDMGDRLVHYETLQALRTELRRRELRVEIAADEWCNSIADIQLLAEMQAVDMVQIKTPVLGGLTNSIAAVLLCRKHGLKAYLGGTCNETERSDQLCVHVAIATSPYQMLAKPGMGVDEGFMIVKNEMVRAQTLLRRPGSRT